MSASEDKRLTLHDVRYSPSGKPGSGAVATLTGHSSWVLSTDISPDGRLALSGWVHVSSWCLQSFFSNSLFVFHLSSVSLFLYYSLCYDQIRRQDRQSVGPRRSRRCVYRARHWRSLGRLVEAATATAWFTRRVRHWWRRRCSAVVEGRWCRLRLLDVASVSYGCFCGMKKRRSFPFVFLSSFRRGSIRDA